MNTIVHHLHNNNVSLSTKHAKQYHTTNTKLGTKGYENRKATCFNLLKNHININDFRTERNHYLLFANPTTLTLLLCNKCKRTRKKCFLLIAERVQTVEKYGDTWTAVHFETQNPTLHLFFKKNLHPHQLLIVLIWVMSQSSIGNSLKLMALLASSH